MNTYYNFPEKLSEVFETKTTTYKFYWMLALLDAVKSDEGQRQITFTEMVARMVSKAWVPVTSGLFSFGESDALMSRIHTLIFASELNLKDVEERVCIYLLKHASDPLVKDLVAKMTVYVPYRFLYPWVGNQSAPLTREASQNYDQYACPYAIMDKAIVVHPQWAEYFRRHSTILRDFTKYNLILYLAKHNNNILLPEEEALNTTADGMSVSSSFVREQPTAFGKQSEKNLREENRNLKHQVKETKELLKEILRKDSPIINYDKLEQLNINCTDVAHTKNEDKDE